MPDNPFPVDLIPGIPVNALAVHRIASHDDGKYAAEWYDDTTDGVVYGLLIDGNPVGTVVGLQKVVAWLRAMSRDGEVFDVELLGEVQP